MKKELDDWPDQELRFIAIPEETAQQPTNIPYEGLKLLIISPRFWGTAIGAAGSALLASEPNYLTKVAVGSMIGYFLFRDASRLALERLGLRPRS